MQASRVNRQLHLIGSPAIGLSFDGRPESGKSRSYPDTSRSEQSHPPLRKLIRIKTVLDRVPVSRSQLYNMIAAGNFPKQIHAGGGQSAFWVESEVEEWIQLQIDSEREAA